MKRHLIAIICVFTYFSLGIHKISAQTQRLIIDSSGKLKSPLKKAFEIKSKDDTGLNLPISIKQPLVLSKAEFYKKLLKVAQAEVDALDNNSNGIADRYKIIFGSYYQTAYLTTLKIRDYLADTSTFDPNSSSISLIKKITDTIKTTYYTKTHLEPLKGQLKIDVVQVDPLKIFLIAYYQAYYAQLGTLKIADSTSKKNRATLLKNLKDANNYLQEETKLGRIICIDDQLLKKGEGLLAKLKSDGLFSNLSKSSFIEQTLWLNGGIFRLSPFSTPDVIDQKNADLFDKIIKAKIDSIAKCCENDPTKIETLLKAASTGSKRFKIGDGTTAFGYKNLNEVKSSFNVINRLLVPVKFKRNCNCPGYAQPFKKKWVISYDASAGYINSFPCVEPAVPEDEQVVIAVNNVPITLGVNILASDQVIPDQSKAQAALGNLGTDLGTAATNILPLASIIPSFLNNITPVPVPRPVAINTYAKITPETPQQFNENILASVSVMSLNVLSLKTKDSVITKKIQNINFYKARYQLPNSDSTITLIIRNHETHRQFLRDYIQAIYSDKLKENDQLMFADYFGDKCNRGGFKIINDTTKILGQTLKLIEEFNNMIVFNNHRKLQDKELSSYVDKYNFLLPVLNVDFPDLSHVILSEAGQPVMRTILSTFDKPKAPLERIYTIQEETAKPIKDAAAKTVEPSATDSIKTNVLKSSYKVGKKYYLQVSAGLAYTFKDYIQNDASITNNQLTITPKNHQIDLAILIHYYPLGLFKLDNTIIGTKNKKGLESHFENRFSIVAGIGIPDPLKNYYLGVSEDLLPGIRLTFGKHLFLYNKYQVLNNVIDDQSSKLKSAGWYMSINFDSDFVGKFIGLFK